MVKTSSITMTRILVLKMRFSRAYRFCFAIKKISQKKSSRYSFAWYGILFSMLKFTKIVLYFLKTRKAILILPTFSMRQWLGTSDFFICISMVSKNFYFDKFPMWRITFSILIPVLVRFWLSTVGILII